MPENFFIYSISGFVISIIVMFFYTRLLVSRVLKKYVLPDLEANSLQYQSHKILGPFKCGLFEPKEEFNATSFFSFGSNRAQKYFNLTYTDSKFNERTVTVKIETYMWAIDQVWYSSELV